MKHSRLFGWGITAVCILLGGMACTSDGRTAEADVQSEEEEAELALYMTQLQRWTHKTALALQARNPDLADFYLHEMEESVETIQSEAPTYEGHAIAELTDEILVPSVDSLDRALDNRDWSAVDARLQDLARSCNQCHESTDHGFVRIDLEDVPNPYTQDFSADGP